MKKFVYIFVLLSVISLNANAEPRGRAFDRDFGQRTKYVPEIIEITGTVRSRGPHALNTCNIRLEIVEEATGEVFKISEPAELASLHCSTEKDLNVSMKAEKTPRFLFWGGNLKVKEFEVLEELEAQPHIASEITRRPSAEGLGRRIL